MSDLIKRGAAGALLIVVVIASAREGGRLFLAVMTMVVGVGTWEFYGLVRAKGGNPNVPLGVVSAITILQVAFWGTGSSLALLLIVEVLLILTLELWRRDGSPLWNLGGTALGVIYIGGLGSFPVLIRQFPSLDSIAARDLLVLVFATIWASDTVAYLVGRKTGRHRLFPRVSPGKSVEGAVAGLVGAVATTLIGTRLLAFLSPGEAVALGLTVAVGGLGGDLVESLMKRDAGVKDTSGLIPGHGGILDRFDSALFAFPLVYVYIRIFHIF